MGGGRRQTMGRVGAGGGTIALGRPASALAAAASAVAGGSSSDGGSRQGVNGECGGSALVVPDAMRGGSKQGWGALSQPAAAMLASAEATKYRRRAKMAWRSRSRSSVMAPTMPAPASEHNARPR